MTDGVVRTSDCAALPDGMHPLTLTPAGRLRTEAWLTSSSALSTGQSSLSTCQLTYLCPPGHYIRLISTATTGSPTFGILNQVEIVLG